MAQAAQMLERIRGRDASQLRRRLVREADGEALEQAAAIRVADARRVDNAMRRDGGDIDLAALSDDRGSVLAARDDQRFRDRQQFGLPEAGLLPQQLELVVVDDDDRRAGD